MNEKQEDEGGAALVRSRTEEEVQDEDNDTQLGLDMTMYEGYRLSKKLV